MEWGLPVWNPASTTNHGAYRMSRGWEVGAPCQKWVCDLRFIVSPVGSTGNWVSASGCSISPDLHFLRPKPRFTYEIFQLLKVGK